MNNTVTISMCVGSACHLRGSREVIEAMQDEVTRRGLKDRVLLKASFCLGKCGESGVTVQVGEDLILGVSPEGIPSFFDERVMPLLN